MCVLESPTVVLHSSHHHLPICAQIGACMPQHTPSALHRLKDNRAVCAKTGHCIFQSKPVLTNSLANDGAILPGPHWQILRDNEGTLPDHTKYLLVTALQHQATAVLKPQSCNGGRVRAHNLASHLEYSVTGLSPKQRTYDVEQLRHSLGFRRQLKTL